MATEASTPTFGVVQNERRFAFASALGTCALAMLVFSPILYYMVLNWRDSDDYSHGFLVAPLAVYFAWEQRRKLRRAVVEPPWRWLSGGSESS